MTIASFRSQFAAALRSIDGLRASEYITESINPPHALFDFEIQPDLTFGRGADVYRVTGTIFCERTAERASQVFLDTLRDPTSEHGLKQTIETHPGLAAVVDYARVTRIGRVDVKAVGGIEYLAMDFDTEVVI